ncbi:MAG: hypothetical protein MI892_26385 [Desulfobacterales bacterium]|nr:hypothetical protein [Desulfobacterales bacterium]
MTEAASGDSKKRCIELIHKTKVMTLGTYNTNFNTSNGNGKAGPWTAPVYYHFKDNAFYFFSNPKSRHIQQGLDSLCSASIFKDANDFTQLEGIQMDGHLHGCSVKSVSIAVEYCKRFGLSVTPANVLDQIKTQFHARFYRFIPKHVFYMDNDKRMGTRTQIYL